MSSSFEDLDHRFIVVVYHLDKPVAYYGTYRRQFMIDNFMRTVQVWINRKDDPENWRMEQAELTNSTMFYRDEKMDPMGDYERELRRQQEAQRTD